MKIFFVLLFTSLLFFPGKGTAQCLSIHSWADANKEVRKFCFYPTTLRMINLNHDASFNTLVKDIHKLQIFMLDNKKQLKQGELSLIKNGIRKENYKDMMQFHQGKSSIVLFVKETNNKPAGYTGIIDSDEGVILFDLEGYLSPEVIQMLISGKMNTGSMSKIFSIMQLGKESRTPNKK